MFGDSKNSPYLCINKKKNIMLEWKEIRTEENYFESSGETVVNSIAKDVVDDIIKGYNEGWVLFVPRSYGCPQTLYIEGEDTPDIKPLEYTEDLHVRINNALPADGYYTPIPMTPNGATAEEIEEIRNLRGADAKLTVWQRFKKRILGIKNPL